MSPRLKIEIFAACLILFAAFGCATQSPPETVELPEMEDPGPPAGEPEPAELPEMEPGPPAGEPSESPRPAPDPRPRPRSETGSPWGVSRDYPGEADPSRERPDRQDRIVEVFYGTDRKLNPTYTGPEDYYTGDRGELDLGICRVNIPPGHREGELEAPRWWRLEFRWNPERHVMVLAINRLPEDDWVDALRGRIAESAERSAFVFVHGYNVTFNDAARRAAQMAYDLEFQGAPILYSWPSQGTLAGYTTDENNVRRTERHLRAFLDLVVERSGAEVIHLIAHSMGNRAVTEVLQRLAEAGVDRPLFNQIALVAPDVDAEVFKEEIVPAIRNVGERLTLYASANDKALEASKRFHGGFPRAGDLEDGVVVAAGLDTIDASDVDTGFLAHSHFAAVSVLSDLVRLFREGKGPEERDGLLPIVDAAGRYWKLAVSPP